MGTEAGKICANRCPSLKTQMQISKIKL